MSRATQDTTNNNTILRIRAYHPLWTDFPDSSTSIIHRMSWSYNPKIAETTLVWAGPRSLAAT